MTRQHTHQHILPRHPHPTPTHLVRHIKIKRHNIMRVLPLLSESSIRQRFYRPPIHVRVRVRHALKIISQHTPRGRVEVVRGAKEWPLHGHCCVLFIAWEEVLEVVGFGGGVKYDELVSVYGAYPLVLATVLLEAVVEDEDLHSLVEAVGKVGYLWSLIAFNYLQHLLLGACTVVR